MGGRDSASAGQRSAERQRGPTARSYQVFLAVAGPRPVLWAVIGALAAADGLWLSRLPISVEPLGFSLAATATILLLAAAAFWTLVKPEPILRSMALSTASLVAFTVAAAVLHYLGATLDRPLVDRRLAFLEAASGFDWQAHVAFLEAHPGLARALALAYHSSAAQIGVVVIALSALRWTERLWRFVQLFVLSLLTVIVVSTLFPARGPYAFYAGVESATSALETVGATWHLQALSDLRSGAVTSLALSDVRGLATFPSFHVCLALITAWALAPIPILGLLAMLLNSMVVVATIGSGGHYLPDLVAGGAIAGILLACPRVEAARRALWSRSPRMPGLPVRSDARPSQTRSSRAFRSERRADATRQPGEART